MEDLLVPNNLNFADHKRAVKEWLDRNFDKLQQVEYDAAPPTGVGEMNLLLRFNEPGAEKSPDALEVSVQSFIRQARNTPGLSIKLPGFPGIDGSTITALGAEGTKVSER